MRGEPRPGLGGEAEHHASYLAFYRQTCIEKCRSLPEAELRSSRLPSGWTPIELLQHLAFMERRWFVWGFLGEQVDDPWGDSRGDGEAAWAVPAGPGSRTWCGCWRSAPRAPTPCSPPTTSARPRRRPAGSRTPSRNRASELRWICFHVLQEYARHAGHLDVAVELAGGHTGE